MDAAERSRLTSRANILNEEWWKADNLMRDWRNAAERHAGEGNLAAQAFCEQKVMQAQAHMARVAAERNRHMAALYAAGVYDGISHVPPFLPSRAEECYQEALRRHPRRA